MIEISAIRDPETRALADRAVSFLGSQPWCAEVVSGQVGFALPEVLGIFLLHLVPRRPQVGTSLWVIVGDLPSAYLVCDETPDWQRALARYAEAMSRWVAAVRAGASLDDGFPVNAAATLANADLVERRIDFIRREILSKPAEAFESDL